MSTIEIRLLTAADANDWWRLRLEALERDPEAFSSSAIEHQSLTLEEVAKRLQPGMDQFVVGAFAEGGLVGMAGFHREKGPKVRHKGRIWGVYVTAERRGSGIGKKLIDRILERLTGTDGLEQVLLSVAVTQEAASRLYRSLGFESFGCEPRALKLGHRYIDEEYMVKLLGARDEREPRQEKEKRP